MDLIEVDLAIVGAGTAGLYALSEAKRQGMSWVLIEGGVGGTTCARVGCMPSKVLLHTAELCKHSEMLSQMGFEQSQLGGLNSERFMQYLRSQRDMFVGGVMSHSLDRMSAPQLLRGNAQFVSENELQVGEAYRVRASNILLATGSSPVVPQAWSALGDRLVTTDQFFEMDSLPRSMAVVGLGAIGLELGQGMSRLGVRVCGYDASPTLPVVDSEALQQQILEQFNNEFPIYLGSEVQLTAHPDGVALTRAGTTEVFEKVLVAIGRRPNLESLNLPAAGIAQPLQVDPCTQRVAGSNIYLAGDVTGQRTVMHEAGYEALMAVSSMQSANEQSRKTQLGIVFTEPNIARVGTPLSSLDAEQLIIQHQNLKTNGRAKVKHATSGEIILYADAASGRLLGAELFCDSAEHLAHSLGWMIEMQADVLQLAKMPVYHPVIEEALMAAIEGLATQFAGRGSLAKLKL